MTNTTDIASLAEGTQIMPIVFDGGPDSLVGMFIPLLPMALLLIASILIIAGVIQRSRRGSAAPLPKVIVLTTTVFLSADLTAIIWWTGYTLLHWGMINFSHPDWTGFLVNFGNRLAQFAWMVPVATLGYIGAWLLSDKPKQ